MGKELRKSGVAGVTAVQELQNGGLSFFLAVESSARSFALWLERSCVNQELQELQEFRSSGVAEWGIELLPGSKVFSSIFCSMVGKELRKKGVTGVAGVQELQNGE
jgi:hypothetical protein